MSEELDHKRAVLEWKRIIKTAKANARPDSNKKVTVATLTEEMNTILAAEKLAQDVSEGVVNHWFSEASKDPYEKLRAPRRAEHCWALIRALEHFGAWETVDERECDRLQLQLTELVKLPRVPATWGRAGTPNAPFVVSASKSDPDAPPEHLSGLEELFHKLRTHPKALVCIEYRDKPRMIKKHEYYGNFAAEAIAAGAHFAMFQPFGTEFGKKSHVRRVRNYLDELCAEVREVFTEIQQRAARSWAELNKKKAESAPTASRLVLYERNREEEFIGSGIQTRLVYACYGVPVPDHLVYSKGSVNWHYVVGDLIDKDGSDEFVVRTRPANIEVIADQFFPVVQYWQKYGELPAKAKELEEACQALADDCGVDLDSSPWHIYSPKR